MWNTTRQEARSGSHDGRYRADVANLRQVTSDDLRPDEVEALRDLFDEAWHHKDEVFTEHLWHHPRIARTEGLRTNRWKYIRYLDHPESEELYDLGADPHEARNLARDARHAARLEELRLRCARAAVAAGGSGGER